MDSKLESVTSWSRNRTSAETSGFRGIISTAASGGGGATIGLCWPGARVRGSSCVSSRAAGGNGMFWFPFVIDLEPPYRRAVAVLAQRNSVYRRSIRHGGK